MRTVLRRHLPTGSLVGRGFIVGREHSSTQIDLLILKQDKPTLFRDGDLAIVTPEAPGAIAEVKTGLEGPTAWYEAARKLATHGDVCKKIAKNEPWLGIFTYEGASSQRNNILDALCQVYRETRIPIGMSKGNLQQELLNHFIRHVAANRLTRIRNRPGIHVTFRYALLSPETVAATEKSLLREFEDAHWDLPALNSTRGYERGEDRHYCEAG